MTELVYAGPARAGGSQQIFRFENGFGVSILRGGFASGGLEVAVLKFSGPRAWDFDLFYHPGIAGGGAVIAHLTEAELEPVLAGVRRLLAWV